ncbi:hypothetical protein JOQ06_010791, partial [Pogonophryne albipinna]
MKKEYASEATSCTLVEHDSSQLGKYVRIGCKEDYQAHEGELQALRGMWVRECGEAELLRG